MALGCAVGFLFKEAIERIFAVFEVLVVPKRTLTYVALYSNISAYIISALWRLPCQNVSLINYTEQGSRKIQDTVTRCMTQRSFSIHGRKDSRVLVDSGPIRRDCCLRGARG